MEVIFWLGTGLELLGVLLLVPGEDWPAYQADGRRILMSIRGVPQALIRRVLRRPRHHSLHGSVTVSITPSGRVSLVHSVPDNASTDRKLAFLLEANGRLQQRQNDVEARLARLRSEWQADDKLVQGEVEELRCMVAAAPSHYRRRRTFGLLLVVIGLILSTVAGAPTS